MKRLYIRYCLSVPDSLDPLASNTAALHRALVHMSSMFSLVQLHASPQDDTEEFDFHAALLGIGELGAAIADEGTRLLEEISPDPEPR